MITIIVDARETNSTIPKLLSEYPELQTEVKNLPCGDYQIGEECVIERKEAVDFVNSIRDGRLFSQAKLMKANFAKPIMIIEGDLYRSVNGFKHGFSQAALQGALSDLVVLEGISVLPSKDVRDSAGLIATMARHLQQGLGYEINLRVGKPKDVRVLQQYIVEGLPGLGGKRAKDILAHFGSVIAVFTASRDDWEKVPGLGKKTAAALHEIVHQKW